MVIEPGAAAADYPRGPAGRAESAADPHFQSVMDSTVSTRAVVESLYRYLPDNGSELVVFDITGRRISGSCFALRYMRR